VLINTRKVKVSRRDAFLAAFGLAYVLLGYSLLNIPPLFKPILHASLRFALDAAPIEFYGWLWIACGAVAVAGGLYRRLDWLGFGVATAMPLLWSLAYWVAEIQDGVPRAWVSGVVYALLGGAVWLVSGMYDPRRPGRPRGGR
jgi:hypothetical protein